MDKLTYTTEIKSVLSFGAFDENGDLLITTEDPTDNSYVSFYINKEEAKEISEHLNKQLNILNKK
jgi:hypothetical protein